MKYTLGLDLGTTSIGWAVINGDKERIEDMGVRLFESAENPKNGESLAKPRREARSLRRRLARRGYRLDKIKSIFVKNNLLTEDEIKKIHSSSNNPYRIRSESLDRVLNNDELFIAVYHLSKRRGYKSNRKKIEALEGESIDKETKAVLGSIQENNRVLKEGGFRTVGEMLYKQLVDVSNKDIIDGVRNKPGTYKHSVSREMLFEELNFILDSQIKLGNSGIEKIKPALLEAFSFQRPYAQGDRLKNLVGKCTFEKEEMRAAKATYSFQYFNFLQKLNNLVVENSDGKRPLSPEEREIVTEKALEQKGVTYEQIKKWLSLQKEDRFNMVNYVISRKDLETISLEKLKDECEKKTKFPSMSDFYVIRKTISEADKKFWESAEDNFVFIDEIAEILTLYKTDEDISKYLNQIEIGGVKNPIPEKVKEALLKLSFTKFGHLSLKALRKIIPHLEAGLRYDEAVTKADPAYGKNLNARSYKLKPISREDHSITNPVVRRTVSQTIKVVNAIIDKYGSPMEVHVELGRDLSKDLKERRSIIANQQKNQNNNQEAINIIREKFSVFDPTGQDIVKYKLWKEQNCKSAYSGKPIDENRLMEHGYVEIDHIIPFSRSFDDSYNNKVLVLTQENQEKVNKLPYECFGADEDKWQEFQNIVSTMNLNPRKKTNLLLKKYVADELTTRTLNDSRFIAKYLKNYIESNLQFAEGGRARKVVTVNGMTTAYLRKRWGLHKDREETSKHHAQDAVIVAVTNASIVQKVATFSKMGYINKYLKNHKDISKVDATPEEISQAKEEIKRHEKGERSNFPEPWVGFRNELIVRLSDDPMQELARIEEKDLGNSGGVYDNLKPIFISHMPRRKTTGQVHLETLRSPKLFTEEKSSVRTPLTALTHEKLIANESTVDPKLYKELNKRLEEFDGDAKKAFAEPFYKTQRDGTRGPVVRSLKLITTGQKSGILLNGGNALVDRASMIRVDIFSEKDLKDRVRYYFIPVYTHHTRTKTLPDRVATLGKKESDWDKIDNSYSFEFSLYPDDLMKTTKNNVEEYWYFRSAGIASVTFTVESHDRSKIASSMGIKTLDKLEKYVVDLLGNVHKVEKEKRQVF